MKWVSTCVGVLISVAVCGGGGVTKQSGISQFWTDDYKVFDHIYGKTSDRDLYSATIPPGFSNGGDAKSRNLQASEKKERFNYEDEDTSASGSNPDPGYNTNYDTSYNDQRDYPKTITFDDSNFAALVAKQHLLKTLEKEAVKPTKPAFQFIKYGDFKPISQSNDPETYNYLKHLEALEKQQSIGFPQDGVRGFKPAVGYAAPPANPGYSVAAQNSYGVSNPENADSYKSIQDILNAHEAKKSRQKYLVKGDVKYVNYAAARKKPSVRQIQGNDISKSYTRCGTNSGRCRKRAPPSPPRVRQVIRKIKIINNDDD